MSWNPLFGDKEDPIITRKRSFKLILKIVGECLDNFEQKKEKGMTILSEQTLYMSSAHFWISPTGPMAERTKTYLLDLKKYFEEQVENMERDW